MLGATTTEIPHLAVFGSGVAPYYTCSRDLAVECFTFVLKLSGRDGHSLRPATLLKGTSGSAIAVDDSLAIYVGGAATYGLLATPGAAQADFGGGTTDGFVAKLSSSGDALLFSTFLGGNGDDFVTDLALNANNMPFVTGWTSSIDFPTTAGAFKKGGYDVGHLTHTAYVTALRADGKSLYYSSYLGGSSITGGNGIAVDPSWNAYVAGETSDADFVMTPGAVQPHLLGSSDAFVAKVVIAGDLRITSSVPSSKVARNSVIIFHARITNYGPDGSDTVLFSNAVPPGLAYEGVYVPSGNGCTEPAKGATTGKLTCLKQRLENAQTYYVNVYYRVKAPSGTRIASRMDGTAWTQDLWPSNNTVSTTITVQ
jgi:hypothetical protein